MRMPPLELTALDSENKKEDIMLNLSLLNIFTC
jgi:hypothetical protein